MLEEAVILAAGFGMRLRPFTFYVPKPLIPCPEEPIVDIIIKNLAQWGIKRFYINVHHLYKQVIEHFKNYREHSIEFSIEKELLLTGGGLKRLLEITRSFYILTHNSDIIAFPDYEAFFKWHLSTGADITWLIVPNPTGKLIVKDQKFIGISSEYTGIDFAGIGIYNRTVLKYMPDKEKFELVPWLLQMIRSRSLQVFTYFYNGFWQDCGSGRGLFNGIKFLTDKFSLQPVQGYASPDLKLKGFVYISRETVLSGIGVIKDVVFLGKNRIEVEGVIKEKIFFNGLGLDFTDKRSYNK